MASSAQLTYRECIGIMLLNSEDEVFVGKRRDLTSDTWQMPQGGIEFNETPAEAAYRELLEEVGTDKAVIEHSLPDWLYYDIPENMMPKSWHKRKYKGQKQIWFLMRFLGQDSDINIATMHPEFMEWRWAPMSWLVDNIVYFKRDLYAEVVRQFSGFLKSKNCESR